MDTQTVGKYGAAATTVLAAGTQIAHRMIQTAPHDYATSTVNRLNREVDTYKSLVARSKAEIKATPAQIWEHQLGKNVKIDNPKLVDMRNGLENYRSSVRTLTASRDEQAQVLASTPNPKSVNKGALAFAALGTGISSYMAYQQFQRGRTFSGVAHSVAAAGSLVAFIPAITRRNVGLASVALAVSGLSSLAAGIGD